MTELDNLLQNFESSGSPNTPAQIVALEAALNIAIPHDLADFLLARGGGEGFVGDSYLRLWPANEWPEHQDLVEIISEWADLVLIGSDGSNQLYGLNRHTLDYVRVERIGDFGQQLMGRTFLAFVRAVAASASA